MAERIVGRWGAPDEPFLNGACDICAIDENFIPRHSMLLAHQEQASSCSTNRDRTHRCYCGTENKSIILASLHTLDASEASFRN